MPSSSVSTDIFGGKTVCLKLVLMFSRDSEKVNGVAVMGVSRDLRRVAWGQKRSAATTGAWKFGIQDAAFGRI